MGSMNDLQWPNPVCIARLQAFDVRSHPVVTGLPALTVQAVAARTTVALDASMLGRDVVVVCEGGDPSRPIIIGVLQREGLETASEPAIQPPTEAQVDGRRLVLSAHEEVVLRCGDASITLTRAGKVLIRGRYVLSQSSGYNRIKGASIDIN